MLEYLPAILSFLAHDLVILILVPTVLLRKKEPASTTAWIFAIVALPVAGAIMFLLFGNDRLARKARSRGERKRRLREKIRRLGRFLASPIDNPAAQRLCLVLDTQLPTPAVLGNAIEIYSDMQRNFDEQLAAIRGARHHVHIEYYIFQQDELGRAFQSAMIAAARRGVEVRFLYDAVGCLHLTRSILNELEAAGVKTACFLPVMSIRRRFQINFRTHRKIVVVDGKVGFTGGANVGLEYLGKSRQGPWVDLHVRVEGPAVLELQRTFVEDWAFASGDDLTHTELYPDLEAVGNVLAQVVPGGPDMPHHVYHELFFQAATLATRELRISTPFLVPSESILTALATAARRGVYVEIFLPGPTPHWFVRLAQQSYYDDLLAAGVAIRTFSGAFIHAKTFTVDGAIAWIGSANLDNRSMKLNFEVGMVFYDRNVTAAVNAVLNRYRDQSAPIRLHEWERRPVLKRVAENFARLFSPVL